MVIVLFKISYRKWIHVLCFKNVNMNDHVRMGKKWYVHYEIRCFGDVLFTYFQWDSPQKPKSCFSKMDSSRSSAVCWGLYYIRQLVSSVYTYIHIHIIYIYMKYLINYTYTWLNCIQIYTRTCVYYIHITHLMSQSHIAICLGCSLTALHLLSEVEQHLTWDPPVGPVTSASGIMGELSLCGGSIDSNSPGQGLVQGSLSQLTTRGQGDSGRVIRWRDFIMITTIASQEFNIFWYILSMFYHVSPEQ